MCNALLDPCQHSCRSTLGLVSFAGRTWGGSCLGYLLHGIGAAPLLPSGSDPGIHGCCEPELFASGDQCPSRHRSPWRNPDTAYRRRAGAHTAWRSDHQSRAGRKATKAMIQPTDRKQVNSARKARACRLRKAWRPMLLRQRGGRGSV